eukprot:m51a1_g8395 putative C-tail anchored protein (270) ;mRNA; f:220667-222433
MQTLLHRLETIRTECSHPAGASAASAAAPAGGFDEQRRRVASGVRRARQLIGERDREERAEPNAARVARLGAEARACLEALRAEHAGMAERHRRACEAAEFMRRRGQPAGKDAEQELSLRTDVLHVLQLHLDECQDLERRRGSAIALSARRPGDDATVTSLPEVDSPAFQLLHRNDEAVNSQLDALSDALEDLRQEAVAIRGEVELQTGALGRLDRRVGDSNEHLGALGRRLGDALLHARSGHKFCVDFVLVVVLLGLGGAIFRMAQAM